MDHQPTIKEARPDPDVIIRSTTEADWKALKAIRLASLLDAPTAFGVSHASAAAETDAAWRERAAGRGRATFILAFRHGHDEAAGMVAYIPAPLQDTEQDIERECGLIAMWVAPALRGTGTAAALVDAVKTRACSEGHDRVVLDVAPENLRAAAFYRKQGFVFLPEWEALASHPHIRVQKMAWRPSAG